MRVSELMREDGLGWDTGRIAQLLLPFERDRVMNLRMSPNRQRDIWYWGRERDGIYTVRSAYNLIAGDVSDMASSEALATKSNIAARIGGECSSYLFCSSFIESSLHLFRDCGVAKWVWEELGIEYGTNGEGGEIRDWVEQVWKEMSATECGVGIEVHTTAGRRRREIGDGRDSDNAEGWKVAGDGYVKINVDARVKEGEGVGTGIVCRDGRGEVAWGLSVVWDESWEAHEAEAMAVLDGLEEAARRGVLKVEVESDSLIVIEALRTQKQGRSIFFHIIDDIVALVSHFQSVRWLHTNRLNNCIAHALAHLVPRVVGRFVWSSVLPSTANAAVLFDRSLIK
ncbi:uncharacterized protein LOC141595095 [Silene latifolia]|uniref:uncharacterized protein LOC141595095 n=1 Tax=Silene latifolia TaxID=37657 RepID=UPI003D76B83C